MALLLKENPVGLDVVVNRAQKHLYSLAEKWNVTIDVYPRCYTTKQEDKKKDIYYYAGKSENQTVLTAEGNKFFFVSDYELEQVGFNYFTTKLDLYVILNVEQIKSVSHRADEECIVDIINNLSSFVGLNIKKITKGADRVFTTYEYAIDGDLQPYFVAKFELDVLQFDINIKNCG